MLSVTKLFRYKTLERESVTKERERREGRYKRPLQKSVTKPLSILYSILFPYHLFAGVLVNVAVAKAVLG